MDPETGLAEPLASDAAWRAAFSLAALCDAPLEVLCELPETMTLTSRARVAEAAPLGPEEDSPQPSRCRASRERTPGDYSRREYEFDEPPRAIALLPLASATKTRRFTLASLASSTQNSQLNSPRDPPKKHTAQRFLVLDHHPHLGRDRRDKAAGPEQLAPKQRTIQQRRRDMADELQRRLSHA